MGVFKHHWWSSMDDNDGCQITVWIILVNSAFHHPSVGLNHYLDHLTNPNWLVTGLSSPWLVTGMTRKKGYLPTRVIYPLVNIQKTMENHHAINGKTQYFYGHGFYVVNCRRLPGRVPSNGGMILQVTFSPLKWNVIPVTSRKLNEYCYPLTTVASWLDTYIYTYIYKDIINILLFRERSSLLTISKPQTG